MTKCMQKLTEGCQEPKKKEAKVRGPQEERTQGKQSCPEQRVSLGNAKSLIPKPPTPFLSWDRSLSSHMRENVHRKKVLLRGLQAAKEMQRAYQADIGSTWL